MFIHSSDGSQRPFTVDSTEQISIELLANVRDASGSRIIFRDAYNQWNRETRQVNQAKCIQKLIIAVSLIVGAILIALGIFLLVKVGPGFYAIGGVSLTGGIGVNILVFIITSLIVREAQKKLHLLREPLTQEQRFQQVENNLQSLTEFIGDQG